MTIKRYQPSNGTEGDIFYGHFCAHCTREAGNRECMIYLKTMFHKVTDKEYPREWRYDENGNPMCTAFKDADAPRRRRSVKQKPISGLPLFGSK